MTFHANFDVRGIPKAQPRHQAFAKVFTDKAGNPVLDAKVKPKAVARVSGQPWRSYHSGGRREPECDDRLCLPRAE